METYECNSHFLAVFENATKILFETYYPTTHLALYVLTESSGVFS